MKRVIPLLLVLWLVPAWSAAQDADALLRLADEARTNGLPAAPLVNKIREGLAKGVAPSLIETVVRQMTANLRTADQLIREMTPPPVGAERDRSVTLVAEWLSLVSEIRLPASDGTAVINEALRRGFRAPDVLSLNREVKRREADYRTGRATLQTLREAIARGERPERLFRDVRTETAERPAAARPEPTTRPETPTRPERPATRPETPQRPETPTRPQSR